MREIQVVAAAIINEQGLLFAARRGPEMRHAGLWELPGGKIEPGEPPEVALAREIREELGADIAVHERLGANLHRYDALVVNLIAYRCTLLRGPLVPTEHSEIRWLPADALHSLPWAPADIPLLDVVRPVMAP